MGNFKLHRRQAGREFFALPPRTITRVLDRIEEAHKVDPDRAASIVADLADALKSNRMHDFGLRYAPAN